MQSSGTNGRLDRVAAHVEEQYRQTTSPEGWDQVYTAAYRWEHTQRVAHYGSEIAKGEGLERDICVAACLLHDIAYFHCGKLEDWRDHGRIGAELSGPILADVGFSVDEIDTIRYAIASHVDGDAGFSHFHTPVADVVSDADNVDRFSAIRVVLWCMTEIGDLKRMAVMLRDRVARVEAYLEKNPLKTKTGQQLFVQKLELQKAFFREVIRDAEITQLGWGEDSVDGDSVPGNRLDRSM